MYITTNIKIISIIVLIFYLPDVESAKKRLKEKFLVEMPQDFFDFLEFCQELNTTCPLGELLVVIKVLYIQTVYTVEQVQ